MLKIRTLQTLVAVNARQLCIGLLAAFLWLPLPPALADVLEVPGSDTGQMQPESGSAAIELPRRGISMSQVEAQFGAPETRHAPVGDPPITRWDYPGFSVFFEYEHVLHSVIPEQPQPIYNKEELLQGY